MKALILAAGRGTRLMPHTRDVPKCLIDFNGRNFLHHQLKTLQALGIIDITIVTGYLPHMVEEACKPFEKDLKLTFFNNLDYINSGTLNSMSLARDDLNGEDLLIINSDSVFKKSCVKNLMKCKNTCVSMELGRFENNSTMVKVDSEQVLKMGFMSEYDSSGIATGVIKIDKKHIKDVKKFLTNYPPERNSYVFHIINHFIDKKIPVKYCLCEFGTWCEIDTPEDLRLYQDVIPKILK